MPDQFSVIRNVATRSVTGVLDERPVETGDARKLIVDRQFMVLRDEIFDAATLVNPRNAGIIVSGAYNRSRLRRLKDQFRSTPLIMEPYSVGHYSATAENPFDIPQEEGTLLRRTLDDVLDDQRASFSDLALTPTGQIAKGDSRALKAALEAVNALDRRDVLFVLPLLAGWLDDEQLCRQIVAVINRSRHPVALAFVSTGNPVGSLKRLKAYRRIMEQATQMVVAYRVDPRRLRRKSTRSRRFCNRSTAEQAAGNDGGQRGQADDPTDLAPHMLIGDMLRYARSKHMRRDWFVDSDSVICNCPFCAGLPIDRLYEGDADRRIGHLHGVVELGRLNDMTLGLDPEQFRIWWTNMAKGAVDIYPRLSTYLGKNVPVPVDVEFWSVA